MDGELALKYARSRHSTSDFDRSNRQQLIIKAIKEKLFGSDTVTSPSTISEIFSTVMDHLDTDMSLAQMAETIFGNRKIQSENIKILSLSNECTNLKQCSVGGYLYNPSRDLFGGASVIIPENARVNKLSYYDDIRRFVDITFRFPGLTESPHELILVSSRANNQKAKNIGLSLAKMGFKISTRYQTIIATGAITQSHVNIYWHEDLQIGIDPKSPTIEALKYLEESLPYITVQHNEYVTDDGPKIEIVLGDDMEEYFPFVTPTYYIPEPPPSATGTSNTGTTISGEKTV
jgi:LytR_cpsA_psr family